jgi:hypothetical protein
VEVEGEEGEGIATGTTTAGTIATEIVTEITEEGAAIPETGAEIGIGVDGTTLVGAEEIVAVAKGETAAAGAASSRRPVVVVVMVARRPLLLLLLPSPPACKPERGKVKKYASSGYPRLTGILLLTGIQQQQQHQQQH